MEHAHAFVPTYDGRIYIEKINVPFLFGDKATAAEYGAGLKLAIERGWLDLHESGTYVKLTQSGADLCEKSSGPAAGPKPSVAKPTGIIDALSSPPLASTLT